MGRLQDGNSLFARDRREIVEKFVEALPAFQIIDEVSEGDASSDEDRCASENLRIAVDDLLLHGADLESISLAMLSSFAPPLPLPGQPSIRVAPS